MLKYLTRYLTGGPISNGRIVGEREGRVYFMARSKKKGQEQVEVSLSNVEFVQQWCLHILPKEFTKTRHFGAWSGSKRRIYLEQCTELAPKGSKAPATTDTTAATDATATTDTTEKTVTTSNLVKKPCRSCPHCQREMACIVKEDRPSSRVVLRPGPSSMV